jgi:hypothetical protein
MVHLFREQDQFLDIYPAPSGWQPLARAVWRLNLSSQLHRTLSKNTSDIMDSEFVLDPKSSVVLQLSDIFRPLEACETNLLVSFSPPSKRLLVKLPRYNLEFSAVLGGASLESKELPGYFVASVQSIGTLVGLQNKLVLKSMNDEVTKIFVPEGEIAVSGGGPEHPRVTISPPVNAIYIKAFSYEIDDIVGRIIGDGSLTSWYRLAYLHIATTSHFADPLLCRTGLQQGQEMLKSAQAFAFMTLEPEHNKILQNILDLVPIREYYPTHLTSMETIEWHRSHSILVQCGRFVPLVNDIVDYAKKQALFHASNHQTITAAYKGEICLWERADFRDSRLVSNGSLLSISRGPY